MKWFFSVFFFRCARGHRKRSFCISLFAYSAHMWLVLWVCVWVCFERNRKWFIVNVGFSFSLIQLCFAFLLVEINTQSLFSPCRARVCVHDNTFTRRDRSADATFNDHKNILMAERDMRVITKITHEFYAVRGLETNENPSISRRNNVKSRSHSSDLSIMSAVELGEKRKITAIATNGSTQKTQ